MNSALSELNCQHETKNVKRGRIYECADHGEILKNTGHSGHCIFVQKRNFYVFLMLYSFCFSYKTNEPMTLYPEICMATRISNVHALLGYLFCLWNIF